MTNLESILKSRDITLPTKIHLVKAMVLPLVMYGCESWTIKKAEHWRISAFDHWCWEDSWESLGLQGDPTSPPYRKSVLNIHWKDWCWSWNSNTLATRCEEVTHWKRPWWWERLKAGGAGDDRRWDGRIASPTGWSLSKLPELVMNSEAWHAAVLGVAELDMTEWLNWTDWTHYTK